MRPGRAHEGESRGMRVMVYTFSSTTPWWRHIAAGLRGVSDVTVVSDLPEADVYLIPTFYRHLRVGGCAETAVRDLGVAACTDIIARCRLLRHLNHDVALSMIGAMWRTIEELLDQYRPDVFLCFTVDRYLLDLFDRALARRGVRYVGLAVSVPADYVMFMARGEHLVLREPDRAEVDRVVQQLTQPDFRPVYLPRDRFGLGRFLRLWAKFTARWIVFEFLMIWRRNPLDFRYLATRWPRCGYRVRLRDWKVMRYFKLDWRTQFEKTPFERRVFVGLSVNPEAAIEYWVRNRELIDYVTVLERLADTFGREGFRLFVKDHPAQFGFRQVELFERLARFECVTFVPYDVPGRVLIDGCHTTFTWTGTVGFEAAMLGRGVIVEQGAYYLLDDHFIVIREMADIEHLPARVRAFQPAADLPALQRKLVTHLLRSSVPGSYLAWRGFRDTDAEAVRRTASLIDSFNRYLPALARRPVPPDFDEAPHERREIGGVGEQTLAVSSKGNR